MSLTAPPPAQGYERLPVATAMPSIEFPSDRVRTQSERLAALDIFRGITIAAMLLVNNPGTGTPYWALEHADWHGWTPTDLIFPFFLFIVGVAIPFSLSKRTIGRSRGSVLTMIWGRA